MLLLFNLCSFLLIWHNAYFMLLVYIYIVILIHFFCVCLVIVVVVFLFFVFFFFFFFFLQAVQGIFKMEEIYHSVAQQLDDERKRKVSAVQTLTITENSNKDLKEKLKAEE